MEKPLRTKDKCNPQCSHLFYGQRCLRREQVNPSGFLLFLFISGENLHATIFVQSCITFVTYIGKHRSVLFFIKIFTYFIGGKIIYTYGVWHYVLIYVTWRMAKPSYWTYVHYSIYLKSVVRTHKTLFLFWQFSDVPCAVILSCSCMTVSMSLELIPSVCNGHINFHHVFLPTGKYLAYLPIGALCLFFYYKFGNGV
jgi:hypothetical protein